jgi:hypothetical protein
MFREHHYLNTKRLGAGVRCYVAKLGDKPVVFIAVAHVKMKANYYRVSRLVVLSDYQGISLDKRLLKFIYLVTSNPQFVRGNLGNWRVKRVGHGTAGSEDTRINSELTKSNSKRRLGVTLQYIPKQKSGGL